MHRAIIRGMAVAGIAMLALAAGIPWFEIPAEIEITPGGAERCVTVKPWIAAPYRLVCLGAAALLIRGHANGRRRPDHVAVAAALLLVGLFFFPYFVMVWDPAAAARASWLHMQHLSMVSPTGDFSINQEFAAQSLWREPIYVPDTPRQVSLFKTLGGIWNPGMLDRAGQGDAVTELQLGQLLVLFEAFGYSDRFCQFIRPGWFVAMAGALGVLLSECIAGGVLRPRRLLAALRAGLWAGVAGGALGAVPLVAAILALDRAREATARGSYEAAERHLRRAAAVLPTIGEDTYYVVQLGLLHWRLGRLDSTYARAFLAQMLERQGHYAQALEIYQDLLGRVPRDSAVHREACRAVYRAGINALNSGRTDRAIDLLETVLAHEACNLKANLALQLAYLRTSRRRDLERLVKRIEAIYAYFQFPTKELVLAFSEENLTFAAFQAGDYDAAVVHAHKAKYPLE
jgi:tetratricopeptide (TPR) repeat protein